MCPILGISIMVSTGDSKSFSSGSNPESPTMEIIFKYRDTIISTPNLEKKLKRMKISLDDIEIIPNQEKKIEDNSKEFKTLRLKSRIDNLTHITYWPLNTALPTIEELVKERGWIWNPETKTGLWNKDYIDTLYYDL